MDFNHTWSPSMQLPWVQFPVKFPLVLTHLTSSIDVCCLSAWIFIVAHIASSVIDGSYPWYKGINKFILICLYKKWYIY